jgi:ketosteroid isomerase-like protein
MWVVGLLGAAVWSCTPPAKTVNVEQEKTALMERDRAWSQSATNIDQWLGYFASDAAVYTTGAPVITGTDSIRAMFARFQAMPGFSVHWTPTKADVAASGELAMTAGTYEFIVNDPQGKPTTEHGKYLTVWKKGPDGAWKVTDDMFNSDEPMPAPPPAQQHH